MVYIRMMTAELARASAFSSGKILLRYFNYQLAISGLSALVKIFRDSASFV